MAQAEYVPSAIRAPIPDAIAQPSTSPIWGVKRLITCLLAHSLRPTPVKDHDFDFKERADHLCLVHSAEDFAGRAA
jgi:hypothetical protein